MRRTSSPAALFRAAGGSSTLRWPGGCARVTLDPRSAPGSGCPNRIIGALALFRGRLPEGGARRARRCVRMQRNSTLLAHRIINGTAAPSRRDGRRSLCFKDSSVSDVQRIEDGSPFLRTGLGHGQRSSILDLVQRTAASAGGDPGSEFHSLEGMQVSGVLHEAVPEKGIPGIPPDILAVLARLERSIPDTAPRLLPG